MCLTHLTLSNCDYSTEDDTHPFMNPTLLQSLSVHNTKYRPGCFGIPSIFTSLQYLSYLLVLDLSNCSLCDEVMEVIFAHNTPFNYYDPLHP